MVGAKNRDLKPLRSKVGIVFQDPGSSLNPRLPIGESIWEPMYLHQGLKGRALSARVEELLDQVELPTRCVTGTRTSSPAGSANELVSRARSAWNRNCSSQMAHLRPGRIGQAKVLELFQALQQEHGFACLFISHDLAVVEMLSDRIAVMSEGDLVEIGTSAQIVSNPKDPYTQRLIAAVPVPDPDEQEQRRATRDRLLAEAAKSAR